MAGFCEGGNEVSGRIKKGICKAARKMLAFQRGLYPMKLFIHHIALISIFWNVKPCEVKNSQESLSLFGLLHSEKAVIAILRNDGICLSVRNSYWLRWI